MQTLIMSVGEVSSKTHADNFNQQDIEKAELASSNSWSSTIVESSASAKSATVQVEDGEVIGHSDSDCSQTSSCTSSLTLCLDPGHSKFCAFRYFPLHKAISIFPRPIAYLKAYYKKRGSENQRLQELYSNIIRHRGESVTTRCHCPTTSSESSVH